MWLSYIPSQTDQSESKTASSASNSHVNMAVHHMLVAVSWFNPVPVVCEAGGNGLVPVISKQTNVHLVSCLFVADLACFWSFFLSSFPSPALCLILLRLNFLIPFFSLFLALFISLYSPFHIFVFLYSISSCFLFFLFFLPFLFSSLPLQSSLHVFCSNSLFTEKTLGNMCPAFCFCV